MPETEAALDTATVYRLRPDCRYRKVIDEGVILRQSEGEVLTTNRVGALIMDQLDGATAVGAILDRLIADFTVDRQTVELDLASFLQELLQASVIEPGPLPAA